MDNVSLEKLNKYKVALEEINRNELISKNMLLSIESSIGDNIFSGSKIINYASNVESTLGKNEIINYLNDNINRMHSNLIDTPEEYLKKWKDILSGARYIKETMEELFKKHNRDVINLLIHDKFSYVYNDDDKINNLESTYVDLRDNDIIKNLIYYPEYAIRLCKENSDYDRRYDQILTLIDKTRQNISNPNEAAFHLVSYPLWSLFYYIVKNEVSVASIIENPKWNNVVISPRVVNEIFKNSYKVMEFLENIIQYLKNILFINSDRYTSYCLASDTINTIETANINILHSVFDAKFFMYMHIAPNGDDIYSNDNLLTIILSLLTYNFKLK